MRFSTHWYSRITDGVAEIYYIQCPIELTQHNREAAWLLFSGYGIRGDSRTAFTDLWVGTTDEIDNRWGDLHNLLTAQGWNLKSAVQDAAGGLLDMDPAVREDFRELILEMEA
jgi:hypothetical protein